MANAEQEKIAAVHEAAVAARDGLWGSEIRNKLQEASSDLLIISPCGPLHKVPLDVLAEIAAVPELANKPVSTAPSALIFAVLRERGTAKGDR